MNRNCFHALRPWVLGLTSSAFFLLALPAFAQPDSANPKELHQVIRVLTDLEIREDESASEAAVIFGRGTMDGTVRAELTSIASDLTIHGTVYRDLIVLFG